MLKTESGLLTMAEKEYIAKEFVIDAIEELKTKPMPKALLFDHLTKLIEIFPTENFAPVKHGHFRRLTFSNDTIICSECKMAYNIFETNGAENFNFCPHCGAKMDGNEVE